MRSPGSVSGHDIGLLFLFGAGQLAIGMIWFTIGARLIPAGEAALLGLLECVCGPIWVWIFLGEDPGSGAQVVLVGDKPCRPVVGRHADILKYEGADQEVCLVREWIECRSETGGGSRCASRISGCTRTTSTSS